MKKFKSQKIFWKEKSELIDWIEKPRIILKYHKKNYLWYDDGTTNVAYNCLEKNLKKGFSNKTAVIFVDDDNKIIEISYKKLSEMVDNFIYYLKKLKKNRKVKIRKILIHSSASIASVVSMLASAKLGIIHCVIFKELPSDAILKRLNILKPDIFITNTNEKFFTAGALKALNKYKKKISVINFGVKTFKNPKVNNITFSKIFRKPKKDYSYKKVNSNHPLFILFTSGSTGEPKGIIHSSGGYLVYSKHTCMEKFGIHEKSICFTCSDAGWINGHTYSLYGPLSIGATTVISSRPLNFLNVNTLVKLIDDYKINMLYLPVTFIRMLKALMVKNFKIQKSKISSLNVLGSMGEPLAKDVAMWYYKIFGSKLAIVNTYFQTETAGIICSPSYKDKSIKMFGTVGKPINDFVKLRIIKNKNEKKGSLQIITPWPGCMIGVANKSKARWEEYFDKKKNFNLFDYGNLDIRNNLVVNGRLDDTLNIRGHRIGSAEIENALLSLNDLKEVCATSIPDNLEGEQLIVIYSSKKELMNKNKIKKKILDSFGSFCLPKKIFAINEMPKTRSGKILRRLLRELIKNPIKPYKGDLSTIIDKNIVDKIKKQIIEQMT